MHTLEDTLRSLMATSGPDQPPEPLIAAARYALFNGGKRLRPRLVLAVVETLGGDSSAALVPAAALEMVHAYSLIHDDLPCMDNDDERRGQPTVHKKFDESTAILAGDFLLTYAFEILTKAPKLTDEKRLLLIQALSEASGGAGMVGGQWLDLHPKSLLPTQGSFLTAYKKKTGDLLRCAFSFGAIIAETTIATRDKLEQLGGLFGLLYQLLDDIDDIPRDGPTPLMQLMGEAAFRRYADQLRHQFVEQLETLFPQTTALHVITSQVLKN